MIHYLNEPSLSEKLREEMQDSGRDFPFAAIESNLAEYVKNRAPWHWHDYMEFAYVASGSVECGTRNDTYVLQTGEGCFVNANVLHLDRVAAGCTHAVLRVIQFETRLIAASGGIAQRYVRPIEQCSGLSAMLLKPEDVRQGEILDAVSAAFEAAASEEKGFELLILENILRAWHMLFEIAEPMLASGQRVTDDASARVKDMLSFIHTRYGDVISVKDIADAASISEREAFRVFRQVLDTTPMLYLARHRINAAARMLRETDRPVTEIAIGCGFSNSSYFCKVFHEMVGMSPRDFRRGGL